MTLNGAIHYSPIKRFIEIFIGLLYHIFRPCSHIPTTRGIISLWLSIITCAKSLFPRYSSAAQMERNSYRLGRSTTLLRFVADIICLFSFSLKASYHWTFHSTCGHSKTWMTASVQKVTLVCEFQLRLCQKDSGKNSECVWHYPRTAHLDCDIECCQMFFELFTLVALHNVIWFFFLLSAFLSCP